MPLTIFIDHLSQPSRAVHWFCQENNIPHVVKEVRIAKGETRSAEFKAINPAGKVPAINDDGFFLSESHAILQYLATTRNTPDHWYPKDPKARALVDSWLHWHHGNLRYGAAGLLFNTAFAPALGLPAVSDDRMKDFRSVLQRSVKFMDAALAKTKFLAGDQISIADLSLVCELAQMDIMGYKLDYAPNVQRWMKQVQQLPKYRVIAAALDKVVANQAKKAKGGMSANTTSGASKPALKSALVFDDIAQRLPTEGADIVKQLGAIFVFKISGKDAAGKPVTGVWTLDLKNGSGSVTNAEPTSKADLTFMLSDQDFLAMASGTLNPQQAFMQGKLKLTGNFAKAFKFDSVVLKKRGAEIKELISKL